jgi:hypothetical protein
MNQEMDLSQKLSKTDKLLMRSNLKMGTSQNIVPKTTTRFLFQNSNLNL